jgi:FlaA1/EpsC-like NDP-sugar epimerase
MLKNYSKLILIRVIDFFIIIFSIWVSFSIRLEEIYNFNKINLSIFAVYLFIYYIVFYYFNIYKIIIRFFDFYSIIKIAKATLVSQVILIFINLFINNFLFFPRSISFIAPLLISILIIFSRILLNLIVNFNNRNTLKIRRNVVIYGITQNTVLLSKNLRNLNFIYNVIGFVDFNNNFKKREVNGLAIFKNDENLISVFKKNKITDIFMLSGVLSQSVSKYIFNLSESLNIRITKLPSEDIFLSSIFKKFYVENVSFHDVINRPKIKTNFSLLRRKIFNKTILVTGAGGSIGSELSRQILQCNPKKLVLFDISELNLFNIYNEIKKNKKFNQKKIEIKLGDCSDLDSIKSCLSNYRFDEIYHAAAYKHVNFLENNIFSAIKNNICGTKNIVDLAINNKTKNFTFISTDKAVNPKSILGITKKIGEMIVDYNYKKHKLKKLNLNFTIVRFGNVIGSSGSAIPLFMEQIKNGGPLTVRNRKSERYFMSIQEAVGLVLHASLINKNFNIYALDMGKQIKIYDIAKRIIRLCGYSIRNSKYPLGDIKIDITKLNKGEKVSEELTLGKNLSKTPHPKILKCNENYDIKFLYKKIEYLNNKIIKNKKYYTRKGLNNLLS